MKKFSHVTIVREPKAHQRFHLGKGGFRSQYLMPDHIGNSNFHCIVRLLYFLKRRGDSLISFTFSKNEFSKIPKFIPQLLFTNSPIAYNSNHQSLNLDRFIQTIQLGLNLWKWSTYQEKALYQPLPLPIYSQHAIFHEETFIW